MDALAKKNQKVDLAFQYFSAKRSSSEFFQLADVEAFTGWSKSSVRTYVTKKWSGFLKHSDDGYYINAKFDSYNLLRFRKHHSQTEQVMKFFYEQLLEKSISACITAIEVYNKPDFKFREETFSILMINSWELLLKAKVLKENNDDQNSVYLFKRGVVELSESGTPKTISITRAINILSGNGQINKIVSDNIKLLIEIRDHAVHFVHDDMSLNTRIQCIGTASLKNFMTLAVEWFSYDFRRYNFFLMPVSLFHLSDIESFSIANNSVENLRAYLDRVEKEHEDNNDSNFSISLHLSTKLVKTSSDETIQVLITNDRDAPALQVTEEDLLRKYPLTYKTLCDSLAERYSDFVMNAKFHDLMRSMKIEGEKYYKQRMLDPRNPKSVFKPFYSEAVLNYMDEHYQRV